MSVARGLHMVLSTVKGVIIVTYWPRLSQCCSEESRPDVLSLSLLPPLLETQLADNQFLFMSSRPVNGLFAALAAWDCVVQSSPSSFEGGGGICVDVRILTRHLRNLRSAKRLPNFRSHACSEVLPGWTDGL